MSYYPRDEQETLINYSPIDGFWRVCSSYPPHARKLIDIAKVISALQDEEGRYIYVEGHLDANQVRLFKPR